MDEYDDAARNIGQGIRQLRDLIDAERERQSAAGVSGQPSGEAEAAERGRDRR